MGRALFVALLAVMLVLPMVLTGCGGGGSDDTTGPRTDLKPEDRVPEIEVQVVDHRFRISGWTQEVLDNDPIFGILASAQHSLDIAAARIDRLAFVDAVIATTTRATNPLDPANVRIITEKAYFDDDAYKPFYDKLAQAGIAVHTDLEGLPRVMHARFIVVDGSWVVTGSYNWEAKEADYTFGDVIKILNTDVAGAFANQFEQMFTERLFGVNKRNDTNHSFLMGYVNGTANGLLEVYFGPTDQPRELMEAEIGQSNNVIFAVQQFTDIPLAQFMLSWLEGNPNGGLVGMMNNIGVTGGANENAIYAAFLDYIDDPTGGECLVNGVVPPGLEGANSAARAANTHLFKADGDDSINGNFDNYATMNHKMMYCDGGGSGGSIIFTTSNYTDLGFTLNDEVMLIMRGEALVRKFWRGIDFSNTLPPAALTQPKDVQELDELMAMFPYVASVDSTPLRMFDTVPCGIVYGEVSNFESQVQIQTGDGTFQKIDIDITFDISTKEYKEGAEGDVEITDTAGNELFFGGIFDLLPATPEGADAFVANEVFNPGHRYILALPAGTYWLYTTVTDASGAPSPYFKQYEKRQVRVGPGCVQEVNVAITQMSTDTGGSGGTGGAGA